MSLLRWRCWRAKHQLLDFVEGNLPTHQRVSIEAHLDECTDCRVEYEQLLAVTQRLRTPCTSPPMPQDLLMRVRSAIDAHATVEQAHRAQLRVVWSVGIAGAIIALLIGLLSGGYLMRCLLVHQLKRQFTTTSPSVQITSTPERVGKKSQLKPTGETPQALHARAQTPNRKLKKHIKSEQYQRAISKSKRRVPSPKVARQRKRGKRIVRHSERQKVASRVPSHPKPVQSAVVETPERLHTAVGSMQVGIPVQTVQREIIVTEPSTADMLTSDVYEQASSRWMLNRVNEMGLTMLIESPVGAPAQMARRESGESKVLIERQISPTTGQMVQRMTVVSPDGTIYESTYAPHQSFNKGGSHG